MDQDEKNDQVNLDRIHTLHSRQSWVDSDTDTAAHGPTEGERKLIYSVQGACQILKAVSVGYISS